jgi:hypothetical protein
MSEQSSNDLQIYPPGVRWLVRPSLARWRCRDRRQVIVAHDGLLAPEIAAAQHQHGERDQTTEDCAEIASRLLLSAMNCSVGGRC